MSHLHSFQFGLAFHCGGLPTLAGLCRSPGGVKKLWLEHFAFLIKELMSHLVTSEALTCECLRHLGHSDSNLYIALRDSCVFLHSFIGFATVTLLTGKGVASSSPDPSSGAVATIQTAGMAGRGDFLWSKWKYEVAFSLEVESLVFLASSKFIMASFCTTN